MGHSVCMWTVRKSDEKIQVLLNYDKDNGYFIWIPKYIYDISLNSSSVGNVIDNSWRENQNTHFIFNTPLPNENRAAYDLTWKNMVEPVTPPMTIWRIHIACWIAELQKHSTICNTYCFFYCNNGCTNAPQCYVIRTLPLLFTAVTITPTAFPAPPIPNATASY
jgi:hypothetical protein